MKTGSPGVVSALLRIVFRILIVSAGAVPGFYFTLMGFNFFLVGSIFSGNQPSFIDAAAFLFLAGLGLETWAITETVLLGLLYRVSPPESVFEMLGTEAADLARSLVFPFLPENIGKSLFQRISGRSVL